MKSILTYENPNMSTGKDHTLRVRGHLRRWLYLIAGRQFPEAYFYFESDGIERTFTYRVFETGEDVPTAYTYLASEIGPAGQALHLYGRV